MALFERRRRKLPKEVLEQVLVPDEEGWFQEDDGWPDLEDYEAYIIVKWNDPASIREVIENFAKETEGEIEEMLTFVLGPLRSTKYWTAIRIPSVPEVLPAQVLWTILNLLEAFSHLCRLQFILGLPIKREETPLFVELDHSNEFGDTVIGCYNEENFQFMLPEGEMMKGFLPEEFDLPDYLEENYEFDFDWLEDIGEYAGSIEIPFRFEE